MISALHEVKAAAILVIALGMVVLIGALAGLGAVLRPIRWSDRRAFR